MAPYNNGDALILNVDDSDGARYAKSRILTRAGFNVIEASNGGDALLRAAKDRPALILLDVKLPDASGMEVLRLLKANPDTASIPVIMVSADAMPEQVEAALTAGAQSYQTKPVHLPTLLQLIDELLRH